MAYIQNKYLNWYNQLVKKAKVRNLTKETSDCYVEIHHIIPRSLGGSNDKENLAVLTAKEHYIAHELLTRFTTGKQKIKMTMALFCMLTTNNCKESIQNKARLYEKVRNEYSNLVKGENHFNYGLIRSEETKELIRQKRALQVMPKECYVIRSEKTKGQIWMNDGKRSYRIMPDKIEEAKQKGYVMGRFTNYITEDYKEKIKNKTVQQWHNIKEAGCRSPKEYAGESKLAT